ncbi:hypothetical protein LAZ67_12001147 [Cordylochernes scorpioides]|uniref:PiggyBac transposable element-derived protein domain-containing protein n=1 Tax=Cordylochernes scorpioides TaxID=51811 RepID=A0ABY6L126_9ARAC|nr:hypothetical protein LAZ67_12001147 [Cordylochernes scorpioides]
MEDEILNKNFDDDSETENYSLNESSDVSTDEEYDSILTTVQMSSSNCFIGKNGYKWNKNHAIIGRTRSHNIITHLPGLKGPAKPKPNCGIDIFNLFFTAAIIKQISEFTNAKIEEFRQRISDLTKSTYSNFTSEIEIRAFSGLLYLAGVYKSGHENVESLFASDGTGRDIFRSVMSVKRFLFLLLCIRFDNFKTRCKEDRLSPIRDIFQTIIENFQSCYTPAEYLTVDEMLIPLTKWSLIFSTSRRSRRWPLALFYALLDITALNSYIIFNYQIDKKDQKERSTFIVDLGRSLIDEHLATRNLNSLPLELQTTMKKFKNNDGSSTSRGSTMPQESDTPKRCYKCPSKNAGKVKTLCSSKEGTLTQEHGVDGQVPATSIHLPVPGPGDVPLSGDRVNVNRHQGGDLKVLHVVDPRGDGAVLLSVPVDQPDSWAHTPYVLVVKFQMKKITYFFILCKYG